MSGTWFADRYYRDPEIFRVNEMKDHAYFIPFSDETKAGHVREESDAFISLNGTWNFHWEPSVYLMEDFTALEDPLPGFTKVQVPENWQLHGVDQAQYQTSPYTFIFDPPYVPEKNPAAAYCREFDLEPKAGKCYELHFEGKDSCIYVWMNGNFVGYGEVPHSDSVFNVTPYLRKGKNRLCVMVLKYCTGSYLDDQDKLRLSGIFRDVYLLEREEEGIRDFRLVTGNDGSVQVTVEAGLPVEVQLWDGEQCIERKHTSEAENGSTFTFFTEDVKLWSAERPYLYELRMACGGEYIRHRFGFREVKIQKGIFLLNDRPVKLYGVNRHDANPDGGYVVDREFVRKELLMMKQNNINAIRTAHYPNCPWFYEMCDELGFYVMAEADMECHGCYYVDGWDQILENPAYKEAIRDRSFRMIEALKNYTSVIIWSLGNESSWGSNIKSLAYEVKEYDRSRLLHYEHVFNKKYDTMSQEEKTEIIRLVDFYCKMYPVLEDVERVFEDPVIQIPYLLSEYSHAMGNSCGDLGFYDDIFQKDDRYAGGFVWEWCDHGLRKTDEQGREYLAYGGDFGEHHHLWNVCQDGLISPDRVPHSALKELKAVYAPVQIRRNAQGQVALKNRFAFTNLSEYLIRWQIVEPFKEILEAGDCVLDCSPGNEVILPAALEGRSFPADSYVVVKVLLAQDTAWAKAGHELAVWGEFLTDEKSSADRNDKLRKQKDGKTAGERLDQPRLRETGAAYVVSGPKYEYHFRKDEGVLSQLVIAGKELLETSMEFQCFRAPTDNDYRWGQGISMSWNKTGEFGNIEYPEVAVRKLRAEAAEDGVYLNGEFLFAVQGRNAISRGTITYHIRPDGSLEITQKGTFSEKLVYWLPRYGYLFRLKEGDGGIWYLGLGDGECYEDKRRYAVPGIYDYVCDDPKEMYERPQEFGSRVGTRWLQLDGDGYRLGIAGDGFSFAASHYDLHQLPKTAHRKDLIKQKQLYLSVDYRMSGVGSASVGGQYPVPQCRINPGESFEFTVRLYPVSLGI